MATFQTSNTGTNRVTAPPWSSGDLVCQVLPSGTTVNTTTSGTSPLDTAGDFLVLFDVPDGAKLKVLFLQMADADTGAALDMDVVLRVVAGTTTTDTVLLNAGAAFQSAYDDRIPLYDQYVEASGADKMVGQVGFKVVTAAATGVAAAAISAELFYQ